MAASPSRHQPPAAKRSSSAAAIEFKVPTTPAAKVFDNIVEKVTGVKAASQKASRMVSPAVDETTVREQAVKLKGLLETSVDADALSEAEVNAAIAELEIRSLAEVQAMAKEAGIENAGRT